LGVNYNLCTRSCSNKHTHTCIRINSRALRAVGAGHREPEWLQHVDKQRVCEAAGGGQPSEGDAEVRVDAQASGGGVDLLARLGCALDV
jgi:hypothetical protein